MSMNSEYTVKLPIFEGPLDLLLHLIKVNEMEITEISISAITSQYLDTVRLMEELDLEIAGEFLVMAATLINIKLRSILPEPEAEIEENAEEETGDDFMTARALMQKLVEYRKFKEAAQTLGRSAERQALIFTREVALPAMAQAQADLSYKGDLDLLLEAFSRVIKFVQRRDYHQVQNEEYTIEDKILLLRRRIVVDQKISVVELFKECTVKIEMIVTLIAVLELCRLKELRVTQFDSFDDIVVIPREGGPAEADIEGGAPAAAGAAETLEQIEADILSQRTGLVDDGSLGEDDEDALLAKLLAEESQPKGPSPELAKIMDEALALAGEDLSYDDEDEQAETEAAPAEAVSEVETEPVADATGEETEAAEPVPADAKADEMANQSAGVDEDEEEITVVWDEAELAEARAEIEEDAPTAAQAAAPAPAGDDEEDGGGARIIELCPEGAPATPAPADDDPEQDDKQP